MSDPTTPSENRALASVGAQFWVNGVAIASFIPRLPEIRSRLGIGVDRLGVLLTLGVVGGFAASAVCGRLIDRFGTKRVMTAASLGMVAVVPLLGRATTPAPFVVALAAFQFCDVLVDVPMNLQGAWLSARRRVPVIHRLHGMWSIGTLTGGVIATVAASRVSLDVHLLAVSAALLVAVALIVPGLLPVDGAGPPSSTPLSGPAEAAGRRRAPGRAGGTRLVVTFGVLGALAIVTEIVPGDWATIRLVDDLGLGPGRAGLGFVAFTAGMVIGRFGGDGVSARLGRRRLSRWAAATSAVGLSVATLSPLSATATGGFLLAGVGAAVVFPGLYELASAAPGRPGHVLGAMTAGIRVGVLATPTAVGALAAGPLTVGQAMLAVALPAAVGLLVIRSIVERP